MRRRHGRRFLFRLALALGRTVGELQEHMTAAELREWMAYDGINPIGPDRFDWLFGQLAFVTASVHSTKKLRIRDFVPTWDPVAREERSLRRLRMHALMLSKVPNGSHKQYQRKT